MILPRSLQGRLLVLVTASVVAVWIAATALAWRDASREIDQLLDGHLAQAAALLVMQQAQSEGEDEALDAPALHPYAPRVVFQVFHEGRLGIHSANAPAEPMAPAAQGGSKGFSTVRIDGRAWRVFAATGTRHDVQVYVGERMDARTSILLAVMRSVFWPMAGALPLLAIATWWAVRRGVAPLREVGRLLTRRDPRALDPVRMPRAPREMQPMLDALNRLLGRIRDVLDSERRFTADAAHELRTPIAAIKAQAQVARAEIAPDLRDHALRAVLEGCDRAARLVDQLLLLARVEAGALTEREPVELVVLAQQVVADFAPRSIEKRQRLELDAPAPCVVFGNRPLLAALIRNLVDNAVRYSPAGSNIVISIARANGRVSLKVEDSGGGLSDADMKRLGERFFRGRDDVQTGSGLGWSIVRRIAGAHGADIDVGTSRTLGGLCVQVGFSARPAGSDQPAMERSGST